jgi:hypothetical protein
MQLVFLLVLAILDVRDRNRKFDMQNNISKIDDSIDSQTHSLIEVKSPYRV